MKKFTKIKLLVLVSFFMLGFTLTGDDLIIKDGLYYKKDMLYTGVHLEFYEKDILKSYFEIKNGRLDGLSSSYYINGQKQEERAYKEGKKNGEWTNWSRSGVKIAEAHFINGKKNGEWFIWNTEGNLLYEMHYNMGKKSGTWKIYSKEGKIINERTY
jgi:antitoxin component YwqK of YwqJK toxin-antitoxin module